MVQTAKKKTGQDKVVQLIPAVAVAPKGRVLETIMVQARQIRPCSFQPRKEFGDLKLLKESIEEGGQCKRIEVFRVLVDDPKSSIEFELVDGERRWRTCQPLEWLEVDIVREPEHKMNHHLQSLIANNCGKPHTHMELSEAIWLQTSKNGKSVYQLAKLLGMSQSTLYCYLRLQELLPQLQKLMGSEIESDKQLRFNEAVAIARVPKERQMEIYNKNLELPLQLRVENSRQMADNIVGKKTGKKKDACDIRKSFTSLVFRLGMQLKKNFPQVTSQVVQNIVKQAASTTEVDDMVDTLRRCAGEFARIADELDSAS
ncbi:hypothetical protein A2442_03935 [Candidatus Campbellbacteria bacterium RIFOXYC2_FULL_35_25]|uniref:ParB-like N-terminal domain-containing protein n=1 Tax=Candidatus Campbellbacteria bacterium RIFOXYC2_FULL_35_25 TaxID=1797582 RepID=A0A1F5EJY1_9BACT|nr:MAG: hypothetical protein A2442_03935 [Candidatus Campbellbacteria bacterium RIFOXYC2_FULL_35_25]